VYVIKSLSPPFSFKCWRITREYNQINANNGDHAVLLLPGIIALNKVLYQSFQKWTRPSIRCCCGILQVMDLADLQVEIFHVYFTEGVATQLMDGLGHDKFSILGWNNWRLQSCRLSNSCTSSSYLVCLCCDVHKIMDC